MEPDPGAFPEEPGGRPRHSQQASLLHGCGEEDDAGALGRRIEGIPSGSPGCAEKLAAHVPVRSLSLGEGSPGCAEKLAAHGPVTNLSLGEGCIVPVFLSCGAKSSWCTTRRVT